MLKEIGIQNSENRINKQLINEYKLMKTDRTFKMKFNAD